MLALSTLAMLTMLATTIGCRRDREIVVFYASSLRRALFDLAKEYERTHPGVRVRLEPSGSVVAVRKVAELGLVADLVMTSDADLIDRILRPAHATWNLHFATNEIILAHRDHSAFTDQISPENWPEVLTRPEPRIGRADPETAPLGYQTLIAWSLASRDDVHRRDLLERLVAKVRREHVASDETELLGLLESRAVDYAFLYRSTAEDHHLKITALEPSENLSRADLSEAYAEAKVTFGRGRSAREMRGAPILYGLTIPTASKNPGDAKDLVMFLLSPRGRTLLERAGLRPLEPPAWSGRDSGPFDLGNLVEPSR